jgi:hypothetical protein
MTTAHNHQGKDWTLTAEAFEKLIDCLDADRENAGEKYEDLRRALVRYIASNYPAICATLTWQSGVQLLYPHSLNSTLLVTSDISLLPGLILVQT